MRIGPAWPRHAEGAIEVVRRCITELCAADHHDDAALLESWLANKTPEIFQYWLEQPENIVLVALDDEDTVWAVGACTRSGEITLNHVSPDKRFEGLSLAMINTLESRLRQEKVKRATLMSTQTAHHFYLRRAYFNTGSVRVDGLGLLVQPMAKQLLP
jgi:hypothetical protein